MLPPQQSRAVWHSIIVTVFLTFLTVVWGLYTFQWGESILEDRVASAPPSDPTTPAIAVKIPQQGYWKPRQVLWRLPYLTKPSWASFAALAHPTSNRMAGRYVVILIGPKPADGPPTILAEWEYETLHDYEIVMGRSYYALYNADYGFLRLATEEQLSELAFTPLLGEWEPTSLQRR